MIMNILKTFMIISASFSLFFSIFYLILDTKIKKNNNEHDRNYYRVFSILCITNFLYMSMFFLFIEFNNNLIIRNIVNRFVIISALFLVILYINFLESFFKYKIFNIKIFYIISIIFSVFLCINSNIFLVNESLHTSKFYEGFIREYTYIIEFSKSNYN